MATASSSAAVAANSETLMEQQLLKAADIVESQLDAELEKLEKIDDSDLERLRRLRIDEMKKQHKQKQEWQSAGHGEYSQIADERDFFDSSKRSDRMICHFYVESSTNCKIVDKHMQILAPKHPESRFCKMNAEKTPFLVEKLKIKMMPTIVLIKEGAIMGHIRGFDSLGGRDDFPTEMLEWRLAKMSIIDFQGGDSSAAPVAGGKSGGGEKSILGVKGRSKNKKSIRDGKDQDSDSDDNDDW